MKPSIPVLVTIVFGFSSFIPLQAHHGMDEYDIDAPVKLVGKVVGTELMDPHSLLYLNVKNEDGTVTRWVVEGGAAHGIIRAGLTRESLALGPVVTVHGLQSRDRKCEPMCRAVGREFNFE